MQLTAQVIVAIWQLYAAVNASRRLADSSPGNDGVNTTAVVIVMLCQVGILYAAGSFSLLVK